MKKMMASACNKSARVLIIVTGKLPGLIRLNLNKFTHKKEAASDTPGSRMSIGITTRNVKMSSNDVGDRRLEIIQSPIIPKIMRKTLDKLGCCVVQAVLVSGSSVCCSKVVAPKWKNKLEVLWL